MGSMVKRNHVIYFDYQFFTRLTSDRNNNILFFDILSGVLERDIKEVLKKREIDIEKKKQYQYNYKSSEIKINGLISNLKFKIYL